MTSRGRSLRAWAALAVAGALAALWIAGVPRLAHAGTSPPTFVQATSAHSGSATSLALAPTANIAAGNRLVVEVGVWSSGSATAASITDSAGNSYVELEHFQASDHTEMSVWSAPITVGAGTRPTITVKPSAKADTGAIALEYSGLSSLAGSSVLDRSASASGSTGAAATVSSGATQPTTAANELALGLYVDSGFGDKLGGGSGYTTRANVSPDGDIELLAEDATVASGATPNASIATGANTVWLASTVVLKGSGEETAPPTVPGTPTAATATSGGASVSWTAPANGNSPITSYTVTPYIGTSAQTPTTVNGSPPGTAATISGLTNGTAYTFTVTATNAVGSGPPSLPSNVVTPTAAPGGEWSSLMSWPFEAIHLFLLSNGHVLAFDGWQQPEPTYVWNPATETFTSATAPASIFCSGMAQLPNGEVMTVGGYGSLTTGQLGIVNTAIFNPTTGTWSSAANMHAPRWYPSVTELGNGDYVAISGNSTDPVAWADTPEVYDPSANTWTALPKVSTSQVHEEEYPFSYLIPNGNVFTIGPSEDVSYELNVAHETWNSVGSSGIVNGSSVMYRPGKILYSGGAPSITTTTPASADAATIDLTASSPKWKAIAPMHSARIFHTLTMLADGSVLAIGGEQTSDESIVTSGVLPTEIWNPTTETWTETAPIATARNYHSTAILLPNATVLSAGGGHTNGLGGAGQYSAQIYTPSYLSQGPRPTITAAPATSTYNKSITLTTPNASSISAVNLVSLGADTHQGDQAQHFVPLSFTAGSGSLTVQTPANSSIAPYGNYMLFIISNKGVPSVSAPLNLSAAPEAPAAPTAVTATAAKGSATVTWTAPAPGTSPITSYTVTPYVGTTAQTATTVSGTPPATNATITGLTNGTTYTFKVSATNAVGSGPLSEASNAVTPSAPTAPGAPTAVAATPGNASASVSWSAPAENGSAITGYTVTPYIGATAQPTTTITGKPPATSATVTGLTNGVTYTFTVTATNGVGTGVASSSSNAITPTGTAAPAFVQQISGHGHGASLTVTPTANLTAGNRLIVEVGVWNSAHATTAKVQDSAGDTFTELLHFTASDGTEMSVWSAPVSAGAGLKPTITATPTSTADIGVGVLEYSGLSSAAGSAVVDQTAQATGKTSAAAVVSTPATLATTAANELVVGFYADSGFEDDLMARMGFNGRYDVSPTGDMELLAEDALTSAAGATPATSVQTGASTIWLMATVVFKAAPTSEPPAQPQFAPANVIAAPASNSATVSWSAPPNGGSQITSYTVTPYSGHQRLRSTIVSGTNAAIIGLRDGRSYRFIVAARNALGQGPASKPTPSTKPSASLLPATLLAISWCAPL